MKKDWEARIPSPVSRVQNVTSMIAVIVLMLTVGCSRKDFRQTSSAMAPTIQSNALVLPDMTAYETANPQRWDVVVFSPPAATSMPAGQLWLMRVIGLPGESLDIRADGVYIDGKLAPQPKSITNIHYLPKIANFAGSVSFPYTIPPGSYFVLGDNTTNCNDSRFWGSLPRQAIMGKVKGK